VVYSFDITRRCNLACTNCYALCGTEIQSRIGPLDLSLSMLTSYLSMIESSHNLLQPGDDIIVFGGEALLHPQINDILSMLVLFKEKNKIIAPVEVCTNNTLSSSVVDNALTGLTYKTYSFRKDLDIKKYTIEEAASITEKLRKSTENILLLNSDKNESGSTSHHFPLFESRDEEVVGRDFYKRCWQGPKSPLSGFVFTANGIFNCPESYSRSILLSIPGYDHIPSDEERLTMADSLCAFCFRNRKDNNIGKKIDSFYSNKIAEFLAKH